MMAIPFDTPENEQLKGFLNNGNASVCIRRIFNPFGFRVRK